MDFLLDFLGSQPMAVAIISATIACCFLVPRAAPPQTAQTPNPELQTLSPKP